MAPVILFTYNRLNTLQKTVAALQLNELSSETDLFIFSDGAKNADQQKKVAAVRGYLKTITGFKSVTVFESPVNKGLSQSIINGVTLILDRYGHAIVLEDDLVTSSNFLRFMNQALDFYKKNQSVASIAGFSYPMKGLGEKDIYFTLRTSSWGWATWKDRWAGIDWSVKDYPAFRSSKTQRRRFNRMGSDLTKMLERQMRGQRDSWAVRFCYHQFQKRLFTVFPAVSKVKNIGSEDGATHTIDRAGRFDTILDVSGATDFHFSGEIKLPKKIIRQFTAHYSIYTRLKYKLLNILSNT